jgi:hypothetical protein
LRLDATVVLMPAAITNSSSIRHGDGLAEAVHKINEGAELLAQVLGNGRS